MSFNIDLSQKVVVPPLAQKKVEEQTIQKQEEEDYQAFVEGQKEQNKTTSIPVDSSSQAAMVKQLFDGKYID